MAIEKVSVTPGSGADIGGDNVNDGGGTAFIQAIKILLGGDGAIESFLQGGYTTPTHSVASIGNTSTTAIAANANRKYLLLQNMSDTDMDFKLGAAAVADQGIRLAANGGSYEMSAWLGNLYTGAIYAIHNAGAVSKSLRVLEGA